MNLFPVLLQRNLHAQCASQARACFVRSCCSVAVQEHDLRASPVQRNVKQALSSHITLHPSHFTSELFSSGFMSSHMSATFFLAIFMSSERSSNFLMRWSYFQLISALLHVSKVERNSKTESRRHSRKRRFWSTLDRKRIFRRKISCAKIAKICWQIALAAWLQPLQYDLRDPAAKDNSITHAAAAPSNLDAATTMRSAETELQSTIDLHATASEIAAPKPNESRRQSRKKTILQHFVKGFLEGKLLPPKLRKSADKSLSQPGCTTPIRFTIFSCKRQ